MRHAFALAILLLTACQNSNRNQNAPATGATTRAQAIAVADAWLDAQPGTLPPPPQIYSIDMGDRWRLSYGYPPGQGGTGGPIIVVVNKRSGEVVHSETEQ
jgi:hypothetical protein